MKEKKLTDEEIVKALENCNDGLMDMSRHSCNTCPYKEIEPCGKAQMEDCLDLIHRQKAEIKRLTEERDVAGYKNNSLIFDKSELEAKNKALQKQVNELTEKNIQTKVHYENQMIALADGKDNKIIKLHKQIDELKQENSVLSITIELQEEVEKQVEKDTAKKIFKKIFESCVFNFKGSEDYKKGFCDALKQYDKQLRDLAKLKGVEVE